jgi:hypothetical protein
MSPIVHNLRAEASRFILRVPDYPANRFAGRGIVICAGGPTYFVQAWVTICLLRELGCTLPIQVWQRDAAELTPTMKRLLESHRVECVNAQQVGRDQGISRLPGWAIKPFAILHSRFREVLYLDSDSLPTRDPAYLFRDSSYMKTGSLFWTDRYRGRSSAYSTVHPRAWAAMNVAYRDEPECESGQLIVDKAVVWRELNLCLHFNHHADLYYQFVYGDKDTFRFAWHRLGRAFNAVPFGPSSPPNFRVLYQLDPQGSVIFQHRARAKWSVRGDNRSILGFQHEQSCLRYLDELQQDWDQILVEWYQGGSDEMRAAREVLADDPVYGCFLNEQFVGDAKFNADGLLSSAVKHLPSHWQIIEQPDGSLNLALMGDRAAPILLEAQDGRWFGERVAGGRESICLVPRKQVAEFTSQTLKRRAVQTNGDLLVHGSDESSARYDCQLLISGQPSASDLILNVDADRNDAAHRHGSTENGMPSRHPASVDGNGNGKSSPDAMRKGRLEMFAEPETEEGSESVAPETSAQPAANHAGWNQPGIELTRIVEAFDESVWSTSEPYREPPQHAITFSSPPSGSSAVQRSKRQAAWSGDGAWSGDAQWSGDGAWSGDAPHGGDAVRSGDAVWSGNALNADVQTSHSLWSGESLAADALPHRTGVHSEDRSAPGVVAADRSYLKIYGMPRTCTNLLTHLIRQNFHAEVFANRLGWKHGPNLFREGDQINGCPLKFVVCVRHPYSWLVSFYRFEVQGRGLTCTFPEFVRGTCKTYRNRNPIERYNLLVRMWQGLAVTPESAQIVRSETLQSDQLATLKGLAEKLSLPARNSGVQSERRRVGPDEQVRRREFDVSYYRDHRYLAHYDAELLAFVNRRLDHDLMMTLQYRVLDELPSPSLAELA